MNQATKPAVWLRGWEWDAVWSITVFFVSYQFWPEFELQVGLRESRLLPSSNHSRRMSLKVTKLFLIIYSVFESFEDNAARE